MQNQYISSKAEIGRNNEFGHGVIIGDDVVMGDGNVFCDYATINGNTRIGSGNYVGDYVTIGRIPTNSRVKYELQRERSPDERFGEIRIGDRNVIREYTNIALPAGEFTTICNDVYIMPHCHIAHDVTLEDKAILSNHCSPGGNSTILEGANLGKGVQVHQRTIIGQYAMLGVGSVIIRNILPAVTAVGNPARFLGVNRIGLERNGFSSDDLDSFVRVLTEPGAVESEHLSPRAREVFFHFMDVLLEGRDDRTLPEIDLSLLGRVGR